MLKDKIKRCIRYIFSGDSWVDQYWHAPQNSVTAGDFTDGTYISNSDIWLPQRQNIDGHVIDPVNYHQMRVDGNGMVPENISNTDILLCYSGCVKELPSEGNAYVIIEPDKNYFDSLDRTAHFDYALRKYICRIYQGETFDNFVGRVTEWCDFDSFLVACNYKQARPIFEDAVKRFDGTPMGFFIYYKEGIKQYSFYPMDFIKWEAFYVMSDPRRIYQNNTRCLINDIIHPNNS